MNIGRFAPFRVRFVPWSIHDNQLTFQFPSRVLGIPTVQTIQQIGANDKVKVRFGVLFIVNGQQVWGGQRLIAFNFFVVHFDGKRRRKCRFDGKMSQQKTVPCARGHGGLVWAWATRHNPYFVRGTSVYDVCRHQKMTVGRRIEGTTKDGDALATWGWRAVVMLVPKVEPRNAGGRTEGDRNDIRRWRGRHGCRFFCTTRKSQAADTPVIFIILVVLYNVPIQTKLKLKRVVLVWYYNYR